MTINIDDIIPKTSEEAKKRGYKKSILKHIQSLNEEPNSNTVHFTFATALAPAQICYYDPNTQAWDDCYDAS